MKKMVGMALLLLAFVALTASSCSNGNGIGGTSIGDGKIDAMEAAEIRLAVGVVLSARPDLIAPAYAVSTAILAGINFSSTDLSTVSMIDSVIAKELTQLKLDPLTQQSFNDFVELMKANIQNRLKAMKIPIDTQKLLVVRDIIVLIQQASGARLGIITKK